MVLVPIIYFEGQVGRQGVYFQRHHLCLQYEWRTVDLLLGVGYAETRWLAMLQTNPVSRRVLHDKNSALSRPENLFQCDKGYSEFHAEHCNTEWLRRPTRPCDLQ